MHKTNAEIMKETGLGILQNMKQIIDKDTTKVSRSSISSDARYDTQEVMVEMPDGWAQISITRRKEA